MKARLLATAILLGACTGCVGHSREHSQPAEVDSPATAREVYDDLAHDLDRRPYWGSPLAWQDVYWGMVEVGVLPAEASHQIRRAALTTISAQDVSVLLEKNREAEPFLVALEARYVEVTGEGKEQTVEIAYGLPSAEALELWYPFAKLVDRHGNSLHWLPVYQDLIRLGYSAEEAITLCRRGVRAGVGRFEVESLIDEAKRDRAVFAAKFEAAFDLAERDKENFPGFGVKAFFKGKTLSAKAAPLTADVGPRPAPTTAPEGEPTSAPVEEPPPPPLDEEPADTPFGDGPADGAPVDDPPSDIPSDEPPSDIPSDEPPSDIPGDEPPADSGE